MDTVGAENSCRENDVNTNMFQNKSQLPKTKVGVKLLEKSSHLIHLFIILLSFKGGYEEKKKTVRQLSVKQHINIASFQVC